MVLEDNSPCPIGKYKGKPMIEVDAKWLLWFKENGSKGSVMDYIYKNLEAIQQEAKKK